MLGDVIRHVPTNYPDYSDPDKVTSAHEHNHGACAWTRNSQRAANGFYCLDNRAFTCESPDFTLKELAAAIPESIRGQVFNLYLIDQQRHWNETPLYVCEEMVCYAVGSLAGLEFGLQKRTLDSLDRALEMYQYTRAAAQMMLDAGCPQLDDFEEFLATMHRELIGRAIGDCTAKGWL